MSREDEHAALAAELARHEQRVVNRQSRTDAYCRCARWDGEGTFAEHVAAAVLAAAVPVPSAGDGGEERLRAIIGHDGDALVDLLHDAEGLLAAAVGRAETAEARAQTLKGDYSRLLSRWDDLREGATAAAQDHAAALAALQRVRDLADDIESMPNRFIRRPAAVDMIRTASTVRSVREAE